MREIKFRVWDLNKKKFIYSHFMPGECCGFYELDNLPLENNQQQYTGIKDKKGKEIYEGDIIQNFINEEKYEVKFGEYEYCEYCHKSLGFYIYEFKENESKPLLEDSDLEIIGNIYENFEIIEEKL